MGKQSPVLEREIETYLVDRVRAAGGSAYKFRSPARRSVPDRIVILPPGRIFFIEVKRPGGKPTLAQERELKRLIGFGCNALVVDTREAIDAFFQRVQEHPDSMQIADLQPSLGESPIQFAERIIRAAMHTGTAAARPTS
ncbi:MULTISPECIES: VRR-NUC domain-containing protein [Burkholderia]|uniref:VRR-NUC domain-containing protein n=1 Tax=Burkholderia TaxID=32008 RepID=UPI000B1D41EA|nr:MULTISPECIES: VRR-NUC domain-containing protein [Burkholderia]